MRIMTMFVFLITLIMSSYAQSSSSKFEEINIQLKWKHQFQFAGYYAAKEKGFYQEEGLNVNFLELPEGKSVTEQVLFGKAEYGVGGSGLVLSKLAGKPVLLVAQIFQHSPVVLASLDSSNIKTPQQLIGKTIQIPNHFTHDAAPLLAMLRQELNEESRRSITYTTKKNWYDFSDFQKVDSIVSYLTNFQIFEKDSELSIMNPRDYGIDFYGDNLFTTLHEQKEHSGRLEKMRRATIRGWKYALANKDEIVDIIIEKYNSQNLTKKQLLIESFKVDWIIDSAVTEIGSFNLRRFEKMAQTYKSLGFISSANLEKSLFYIPPPDLRLTAEEKNWIAENPITNVLVSNWPPYVFTRGDEPIGISIELLEGIGKKFGLIMKFHKVNFSDTIDQLKKGKSNIDILPLVHDAPERKNFLVTSSAYSETFSVIYTRRSDDTVFSMNDLIGKSIAIPKSYSILGVIKNKFPGINIHVVADTSEGLLAVSDGNIDSFVGTLDTTKFIIENIGIDNLKIAGPAGIKMSNYHFGIRSDKPILASIMNKGLASISADKLNSLHYKYYQPTFYKSPTNYKFFLWGLVCLFLLLLVAVIWNLSLRVKVDKSTLKLQEQKNLLETDVKTRTNELSLALQAMNHAQEIANICTIELFFQDNVLKASAMYYEMFDFDPNDEDIFTFLKKVHRGDREKIIAALKVSRGNIPGVDIEFRVIIAGETKGVRFQGEVFRDSNNKLVYGVGAIQDISERLNSERVMERLLSLRANSMRLAKSGSWYVDYLVDPNVLHGTPEYFSLKGFVPIDGGDSLPFDYVTNLVRAEDMIKKIESVTSEFSNPSGEKQESFKYSIQQDNQSRWFQVIMDIERNENGETIYISGITQDITERIRREGAVRENEASLLEAHRIGKIARWYWDVTEDRFDWSDEFYELFDQEKENFATSSDDILNYIPLEEVESFKELMTKAVKMPSNLSYSHRLIKNDGSIVFIDVTAEPMFAVNGKLIGYTGISQDISERRKAEEETSLLRSLVEASSNIVVIYDVEGRPVYLNHTGHEIFGISDGQNLDELHYSNFHPESFLTYFHDEVLPVVKNSGLWIGEGKAINSSGDEIDISIHLYTAKDLGSESVIYPCIMRDITEQKQAQLTIEMQAESLRESQERFNLSIRSANIGVWDYKNDTQTFYMNHILKKILGYSAQEKLIFKRENWIDHVHPNDHEIVVLSITSHLAGLSDNCSVEIRVRCKNGEYKWVNVTGKIFEREDLISVKRMVGTIVDIDDMYRLREDLIQAKNTAEAAVEVKTNFLANISHEIRTPMNAIIGLSYLVLNRPLDSESREYVNNIHQSSNSLLNIINDILDFSKIEAGMTSVESIPFCVDDIMRQVLSVFKLAIKNNGLEIQLEKKSDVPDNLLGDPLRLRQILTNIVGNAVKFTTEGNIDICLKVTKSNKENVDILFTVTDTGIGMTAEELESIFVAFNQANISRTREYGGTGLGLSITKRLVELMGGQIDVLSEKGVGSSFFFTINFPIVPIQKIEIEAIPAIPDPPNLEGVHVLVVEDEIINQQVTMGMLRKTGCHISTANNGKESLEMVKKGGIDCVLMDIQMPVMDGLEATRLIRADQQFKDLPIIAVTAGAMEENRVNVFDAGLNSFLTKPLVPGKFYAELTKWRDVINN